MLPTDAQERKNIPVYSGFICYFPNAIVEVSKVSFRGNEQHNPGSPLHWDRSKSGDELDALTRHLIGSAFPNTLDEQIEEAAELAVELILRLLRKRPEGLSTLHPIMRRRVQPMKLERQRL